MARNLCHFPLQFCQFIKNPESRLFPVGPFCKKILQMKRALVLPRLFFAFFNSFVPNVLFWWRLLCFPSHTVLHAVPFFGPLGVVEAVQRAHQIAGDAADALKGMPVFVTAALGTAVADDAVVAADGVAVNGMVDGAVADALRLHAADDLFKGIQICAGVAVEFEIGDLSCICKLV